MTNSLLDNTLDDLADAPSQSAWPAGDYVATLILKVFEKDPSRPTVVAEFKHEETVELADTVEEEDLPKLGDSTSMVYSLVKKDGTPNEIGQGQLKIVLEALRTAGYPSSIRECVIAVGTEKPSVAVVFGTQKQKDSSELRQILKKITVIK
jgi:hypothetical protein